eukprot:TRINITY_DN439_c0_g1_i10.p2 TRINITY_DN439_c0_g1~~TRINITY_DN439_c0_g1_i10.p2  ORF type:complete len:122 (-),score=0.67 TRINITY_DN439_c0_g1_i10:175-540(-)
MVKISSFFNQPIRIDPENSARLVNVVVSTPREVIVDIDFATGQILAHPPASTELFICNPKDLRPRPGFTSSSNIVESYIIIRRRSDSQEEVPISISSKVPTSPIYYSLLRKIVKIQVVMLS